MPGERVRRASARLAERLRDEPGIAVLAVATIAWVFVMELAIWRRHDRYGTFDLDLGFHTQLIWQLARGRSFSTILGLPAFGHNATFGYFLLVPLSWLHLDGPQTLDLIMTLGVASAVVPVYVLARRRLGIGWPAATLALAWLLHPIVQNMVWETFHPEVLAAVILLWAYVAADAWRWRPYWILVVLAIIWKTDVALFVVMLGIWVALRRNRSVGMRTIALGVVWFVVVAGVMIPRLSGGGTVYGGLYGDLGETPQGVAVTSVRHPSRLAHHIANARPVEYGVNLTAPYGFVPLLAPATAALALPQYVVNILPLDSPTRDFAYAPHYQGLPLAALTLALVEGAGWLHRRRRELRDPAIALVLACGLATSATWGALPFGVRWGYFWSEDGDPLRAAKDTAVAMVGPHDSVSSQYLLTAHFAKRELAYTFPNPWRKQFYGVDATAKGDPAAVDWIVLDEGIISPDEQVLETCILDSGAFEEQFRDREIVVLHRIPDAEKADVACT